MVWSYDDNHIYTGGIDGAVYEWELKGLKRVRESVIKGCLYSSITCVKDVKNFFAVGSDRKLKELDDSIVVKVSRLRYFVVGTFEYYCMLCWDFGTKHQSHE